jgi:hypothetical protein
MKTHRLFSSNLHLPPYHLAELDKPSASPNRHNLCFRYKAQKNIIIVVFHDFSPVGV